jgi:hypothetical protein
VKTLVSGFATGLALTLASNSYTSAQEASYQTYYGTVTNSNCVGTGTCTFTFPPVPDFVNPAGVTGVLFVKSVNCRLITSFPAFGGGIPIPNSGPLPPPFPYAALGKTANLEKVYFLSASGGNGYQNPPYTSPSNVYGLYLIDQKADFYVQTGVSPTVTITLWVNNQFAAPNPSQDLPTCSVAGIIE